MSDFKVGDIVKVVSNSYSKGEIGQILDTNYGVPETTLKYLVDIPDYGGITFAEEELELVTPPVAEDATPLADRIESLEARVQALENLLSNESQSKYPVGTVVRLVDDTTTTFRKTGYDVWTATFDWDAKYHWSKTEEYILSRGIAEVIK